MRKSKVFSLLLIVLGVIFISVGAYLYFQRDSDILLSPLSLTEMVKEKPLDKYSFDRLVDGDYLGSKIVIGDEIGGSADYKEHIFSYYSENKKITGQINIPTIKSSEKKFPVIVMLRGYVDPSVYKTGDGTRNAAAFFARKGFVTIAPDFLGYGGSDNPDENSIGARVKRPATVLNLIFSLSSLNMVDEEKLFLWGHSNGGQIALTVLEVLGKMSDERKRVVPTSLWAPVSKPFPYSILYYTDEYDDYGKAIRKVLAEFEEKYDVNSYSIHEYYDWIDSPIQVHQGGNDDAIPIEWSNDLVETFEKLDKEVIYFKYLRADHNLRPDWDTVVARDLNFYNKFLNKAKI